jgi:hypothetical protein
MICDEVSTTEEHRNYNLTTTQATIVAIVVVLLQAT